jgi:hypothetical protein
VQKIILKMLIFGFFWKADFPAGEKVNIMADANFLVTYLKIGLDCKFDIKIISET